MEAKAIQLGQGINIKQFQKDKKIREGGKNVVIFKISANKWFALVRYGVIVLGNIDATEERKILKSIKSYIINPTTENPCESIEIKKTKGKEYLMDGILFTKNLSTPLKQLIVVILARSVVLEFFEKQTDHILFQFGEITEFFKEKGRIRKSSKNLLKLVGTAMNIKNRAVSQMAMLDKPDLVWEDAELDLWYQRLEGEYEISERYTIVKEKIDTLFGDSEFILNYLENRRILILEVIIVVLIMIEVVILIYDLWG